MTLKIRSVLISQLKLQATYVFRFICKYIVVYTCHFCRGNGN